MPEQPHRRREGLFFIPSTARLTASVAAVLLIVSATGHVQGAEAVAAQAEQPEVVDRSADSTGLRDVYYQVQVLQREVATLRGLVEDQSYQLRRLAQEQSDQYLDLDRRLSALQDPNASQRSTAPGATPGSLPDGTADTALQPGDPSADSAAAEKAAYTTAFNLMRNRDFDSSIDAFGQMLANFPNGHYVPNGHYWLGELYLAKQQTEAAREEFARVVNLFPEHLKYSDALYKLGVAYHQLGDTERALEALQKVQEERPDSSAAELAKSYAAELQ